MLSLLRAHINHQTLVFVKNTITSIHHFFSQFFTMNPTDQSDSQSPASDPPPFDPSKPSVPISYPIKSLDELESRSYFDSFHFPFNKSSLALRPSSATCLPNRPRLLVCHDMAGGYTDDKWVQGGKNPDAYAIWHWYLIDVFVYFSHSLVTLPPPCWTNTAHKHGVKVLGTFILEWDEGKVISNKLLSSKESAQMYAVRLTELAVALGFDGWLINMEVKVDVGQIPNLKEFVSHLTWMMHSLVPGSLVIWYDSVTINGDLNWQDQLNENNKPFFDRCDGIFVNYTWKEDYPKLSAAAAGDRKFDVYMGIDVFGRNTYGGGQWTTDVALDVVKKNDVSAAIFAPGWVHETQQPPDFQTAQNCWWGLVEKSWGIVQKYPKVLPFYSNFDQGHGYHFSADGKTVSDAPWNNISLQSFQPLLEFLEDPTKSKMRVTADFKEASYSGGGNISFKGTLAEDNLFITRLFEGDLLFGGSPVGVTYSVKSDASSLLGLLLEFSSAMETKSVLLASKGDTLLTMNRFSRKFDTVIMPRQVTILETAAGWFLQESIISMDGFTLKKIHAVCYKSKPEVSIQGRGANSSDENDILVHLPGEYYAVIGHVTIRNSAWNAIFPQAASWLVEGHYVKWTSVSQLSKFLSFKLSWKLKDGDAWVFQYNIYVENRAKPSTEKAGGTQELLGVAHVETYYISDLEIPSGISNLKFIIQVCNLDGSYQKLEDSPSFQLHVEYP